MAVAADELLLLERVFLRIGSAETDEQLQNAVSKFLPPVLLKLSSTQEGVRKKVMELLVHINKRIKSRPTVQLPVEALLVQYQDPAASSFVTNFTIIYLKLGFPRLSFEKQTELVPTMLNSLEGKPQSHQDSLLLMIIPLLGHVTIPADPAKRNSLFGLNEKPHVSKHLCGLMLDMLLLPYGATSPDAQKTPSSSDVKFPVPPGMSEYSYKRVTTDNCLKPEELEQIKQGIVKFISFGVFPEIDILIHLIVAAADTRFSVANSADLELKKIVGSLDWGSTALTTPLYMLFLGSQSSNNTTIKPEMKKSPASTRIRLKLLHYLCRVTADGFIIPPSIQIIFDSLYGTNTNPRLKTLALNFASNLIRDVDAVKLARVTFVLLAGLQKFLTEGDIQHHGQIYVLMGQMGRRFPILFQKDIGSLESFLNKLLTATPDLRLSIREALLNIAHCYTITEPEYANEIIDLKNIEKTIQDTDKAKSMSVELRLIGLISYCLRSTEPIVRFVAVRYAATAFPDYHVGSRYLLLLSTGDSKDEVFMESLKTLYGTPRKFGTENTNLSGIKLPEFVPMCAFVSKEAKIRKLDERRFEQGNVMLPFAPTVYTEILAYLRLCLAQGAQLLSLNRGITQHPNETTPLLGKYLRSFCAGNKKFDDSHSLKQYLNLIQDFMGSYPGVIPINCLLEVMGCIPDILCKDYVDKLTWFKGYLSSTKEEIREQASILYGVLTAHALNNNDFDKMISELVNTTKNNKNLENQHGSILALANCLERRISIKKSKNELHGVTQNWEPYANTVKLLISFLDNANPMLVMAACMGIGLLGRCYILPLSNNKKPDEEKDTKLSLVNKLLEIMNSSKYQSKIREKAANSLGLICVGEIFPFTREVITGLINTAKETKDIEVHFSVGESLVMCVQSIWSNEARDRWTVLPSDYSPTDSMMEAPSDDDLNWLLDQLLSMVTKTHPNSRQASCVWLLALLKHCSSREAIKKRLPVLQNAFKDLLAESSDIVQDIASKGLGLVYESCDENLRAEMLEGLLDQLNSGRRAVQKVTDDTKLFEEGQLGKSPTGGNLTTYKEICSLASDLNKPDLIFKFMNLANHNAIWNSKKGAAFGFSTIASKAGEQIQPHLPKIIPRLYRYQFDPTPNLQSSMQRIWNELVPDKQKAIDTYHKEILEDLIQNLTSAQWRVRLSCCVALQDFLRGSAHRSIHDYTPSIAELWTQIFRVMDDYHEGTRNAANSTAKSLSKLCVAGCDVAQGKNGTELMNKMLPVLLQVGIIHTVAEVRSISLLTVSKLIGSAGNSLKPFLSNLIPALLEATGDLENVNLSHLSTIYSGRSEIQDAIDSARASAVKSHYTMDTLSKCLQYVDITVMDDLVPKVTDIMRNSVGLGIKVACAHFIILLTVQLGKSISPYTGRFLSILMNGLTDRNAAVRKQYAIAIGHLVATAKDSSIEKLFAKLQNWYFKLEDESVRSVIAHTIRAIGVQNQEVLKTYSHVVLPLVFFAMHAEKTEDTKDTIELWSEIWSENSPGTETGIRQNLKQITKILETSLESANWNIKSQAANATATVATKLGGTMDPQLRNLLINMLISGLSGRTWNGKEKLIKALASICKNCKEIKTDPQINVEALINAVMKECNKEEIVYKRWSLEACGDILESLDVDRFDDLYNIVQDALSKDVSNILNEDSTSCSSDSVSSINEISVKRENILKLKEVIYETLGKAWPINEKTQEKYRNLFVEHCVACLPTTVRNVQVSIVLALQKYVEKLTLLQQPVVELTKSDRDTLNQILNHILEAMKITLGLLLHSFDFELINKFEPFLDISKHLRLRRESLNVLICLCKRLKAINASTEVEAVCKMLNQCLSEIEKDPQPEIKTRVIELKDLIQL